MILVLKLAGKGPYEYMCISGEKFTDQHSLIDENSMGDWNRVTDPTHINGETREAYRN